MSEAEEQKRQYDAACKNVLSEKGIIANILQDCVGEFQTCSIDEIVNHCIEGQPETGTVLVEPNGGISRITSQQVEDKSEREGTVFYDIRFTAVAPSDGKPIRLIINIEAQNNFHPGYPLLKRAIYYCSRMISSQYGTVFTKSHYEKIEGTSKNPSTPSARVCTVSSSSTHPRRSFGYACGVSPRGIQRIHAHLEHF